MCVNKTHQRDKSLFYYHQTYFTAPQTAEYRTNNTDNFDDQCFQSCQPWYFYSVQITFHRRDTGASSHGLHVNEKYKLNYSSGFSDKDSCRAVQKPEDEKGGFCNERQADWNIVVLTSTYTTRIDPNTEGTMLSASAIKYGTSIQPLCVHPSQSKVFYVQKYLT